MRGRVLETVGFIVEACLFIMAGIFAFTNHWIAYFFLIMALIMANLVGKQIAINAINKFKREDKTIKWNIKQ